MKQGLYLMPLATALRRCGSAHVAGGEGPREERAQHHHHGGTEGASLHQAVAERLGEAGARRSRAGTATLTSGLGCARSHYGRKGRSKWMGRRSATRHVNYAQQRRRRPPKPAWIEKRQRRRLGIQREHESEREGRARGSVRECLGRLTDPIEPCIPQNCYSILWRMYSGAPQKSAILWRM